MKAKRKHGSSLTSPRQMCNRGQPCEGCIRRNQASSCRYAPNAIRTKPRPAKVGNIQERLDNLEMILSSIASNPAAAGNGTGTGSGKQAASSSSKVSASYQQYQVSVTSTQSRQEDHVLPPELPHRHESGDGQVSYIDPSHWRAILDEIKEVREHLSAFDRPLLQEEPERKSFVPEESAGFMFGTFPVVELEDVISSLPARSLCDALVSQYFNAKFMVLGMYMELAFWQSNLRFCWLMQVGYLSASRHSASGQVPERGQLLHGICLSTCITCFICN